MTPVLYAEDENDDVFFMQYAWEQVGIPNPLIVLPDGQQALDYLAGTGEFVDREKNPLPCLLLLDLNLPRKGGFEILHWLRENPIDSLKVVVVSGSQQESDVNLARSLGAIDYIVKPNSPARLAEILQQKKKAWLKES